jgi:hypothetical protein
MFHGVPIAWQYAILAGIALAATLAGLWIYNRREKRRKHAIDLMKLMNQWGLDWFADLFELYGVGDYSGLVVKVEEVVKTVRSDTAMVSKLGEVAKKVAAYYAQNDPTKAAELQKILAAATTATTTTSTTASTAATT